MKSKKILIVSLLIIILFGALSVFNPVFAKDADDSSIDPATAWSPDTTHSGKLQSIPDKIIGFVQIVGSAIAVIMIIVLGIKYMMGSAEEKAEYKKTMIPYLIGAICIFAGANIASAIYSFANSLQ